MEKRFLWSHKLGTVWALLVKQGSVLQDISGPLDKSVFKRGLLCAGLLKDIRPMNALSMEHLSVYQTWCSGVAFLETIVGAGLTSGGLAQAPHFTLGGRKELPDRASRGSLGSGPLARLLSPVQASWCPCLLLRDTCVQIPGSPEGPIFLSNGLFWKGFGRVHWSGLCPHLCPGL